MKQFITTTAFFEGLVGLGLILFTDRLVEVLLGHAPQNVEVRFIALMTGAALLSLGVLCWKLRKSSALRQLAEGMSVYNFLVIGVIAYGILSLQLKTTGLYAVVVVHGALLVWGGKLLFSKKPGDREV